MIGLEHFRKESWFVDQDGAEIAHLLLGMSETDKIGFLDSLDERAPRVALYAAERWARELEENPHLKALIGPEMLDAFNKKREAYAKACSQKDLESIRSIKEELYLLMSEINLATWSLFKEEQAKRARGQN
jgi:hypothetical protein